MHTRRIAAHPPGRTARGGLTLFEIVLALAIFTMAMAALSQLISVGTRAKNTAQFHTEAAIRAENKMAEIVAGYQPLSAVAGEADPENNRWLWSLDVVDAPNATGLKELTVTVTHLSQVGEADASYSIKRLIRDPQLYVDAALAEEQAAAQSATKVSNSNSSGGGGGTGSTGSSGTTGASGAKTSGRSTGGAPKASSSSGTAPKSSSGGNSAPAPSKGKSR